MPGTIDSLLSDVSRIRPVSRYGRVASIQGLLVEVAGAGQELAIGARVAIEARGGHEVPAEVVGFSEDRALLMPFSQLEGVGVGCKAYVLGEDPVIYPCDAWLGRVVDAMGEPVDGKGPLPNGSRPFSLRAKAPLAHMRQRVGSKLDLGVRSLNAFASLCRGQRMGIFSGSGVGKSVLLSMLARYTKSDVSVIGLIGERGRELQEFIQDDLGEEGLKRSVVVVATSDESALKRRQAAYLTMTLSEYFRTSGCEVLCLMDSITRFAMAQREIGLAAGEPPASKGYTPTVFTELPKLLERAGPGLQGEGNITGLFSVLVEGDDHNEPVADAVRGILDGHIVMDRTIAERGRYPAVDVLRSISRTMPDCNTDRENSIVREAKKHLSTYADMEEMVRLGAYKKGSDPEVDRAIELNPALEAFLAQDKSDCSRLEETYKDLARIIGMDDEGNAS